MRFDASDQADGSQVEDRRGGGFRFPGGGMGAGAGGLGIIGLLIVGAIKLLGGDVVTNDGPSSQGQTQRQAPGAQPHAGPEGAKVSGSCEGVTSATDQGKFIACVETNVQSFWTRELPQMNGAYHPARLVLFTEATQSGCGEASAATGPFYCPPDQKV